MATAIRNIAEWKSLPELPIRRIATPHETGVIHHVLSAGMLIVSVSDCHKQGLSAARPLVGDQTVLPTVTIRAEAGTTVFRLPLELAPWVAHTCALAEQGTRLLPSEVEFSDLNGKLNADLH